MLRRVWFGAIILVLAVVGMYWLAAGHDESKAVSNATFAGAATVAPKAQAASSVPATPPQGARHHASSALVWEQKGYPIATDGSFAVPPRYQFAGVGRVQTADGFENWMAHFSAADQKILRAFDDRNHGVYRDRTAQSVAWMAAHGYPMPEDLLAAQAMSTDQLRQMAKNGDVKAAFILRDRDLTEFAWKIKHQGADIGSAGNDDPQFVSDDAILQPVFNAADSPYKAYMVARAAAVEAVPTDRDAQVISALNWARSLGDLGASRIRDQFIRSNPERMEIRKVINSGSLATGSLFRDSLDKLRRDGCATAPNSLPYNPTLLPPNG